TDLAVRRKLDHGWVDARRRPGLGANPKRVDLAVLAQQLATRRNREDAVVERVPVLITLHVAYENCDLMATRHYAHVLQPSVRLDRNPVSTDDLGERVASRGELGCDDPLRARFRGDRNPLLHEPLVVSDISSPRSKMEERNAEWVRQHRWLSSTPT